MGRATVTIDPLGRRTTIAYDRANIATLVTDPAGKATRTAYDTPLSVTDPLTHTTSWRFDGVGRKTSMTDANGDMTELVYDLAGRQVATVDGRGKRTTTAYDAMDNPTAVTDANGWTTTSAYDSVGHRLGETDPQGATATFAYDPDEGWLASSTDRLGRRTDYALDADGRVTAETWYAAGATIAYRMQSYGYDADGRMTSATGSAAGSASMAYDKDGRVTSATDAWGVVQSYKYDGGGSLTRAADSLGGVMTSVYDKGGRLTSRAMTAAGGLALSWTQGYAQQGEVSLVQRFADAAGTTALGASGYAYDDAGEAKAIAHFGGGTAAAPFSGTQLSSYAYGYDAGGRLTSAATNGGTAQTYSYDAADELTGDGTGYGYDDAGVRTGTGYSQGPLKGDQLLTGAGWTYAYDAEGNLSSKADGAGTTWDYSYDNRDRLTQAVKTVSGTATLTVGYAIDGFGRLAGRTETAGGVATVTHYVRDLAGNAVIDLASNNSTIQARHVFGTGTDQLAASAVGATVTWALLDRQGSVAGLMGSSSTLAAMRKFDGFGLVTAVSGTQSLFDRFGWTGKELDASTGQQYNNARWYDSAVGRWTSRDPIGFKAGDGDLYRYVGNSPTNATDPSGLYSNDIGSSLWRAAAAIDRASSLASEAGPTVYRVGSTVYTVGSTLRTVGICMAGPVAKPICGTSDNLSRAMTKLFEAGREFVLEAGAGILEAAHPVPVGAPGRPQLPPPRNMAGGLGRITGRLAGIAVGIQTIITGAGMTAGGGAATVGTSGLASPVTVPVALAGTGLIVYGGIVVWNGIAINWAQPIPSHLFMTPTEPPRDGGGADAPAAPKPLPSGLNSASASRPTKPGSPASEAAASLDSHSRRPGWTGPKPSGNAAAKNTQAQALVDDVLAHPNRDVWTGPHPQT